jgi:DNA replication protein DnaC
MSKPMNLVDQYLVELRLHGVRETLLTRSEQAKSENLTHGDFLNLVLHDEAQWRRNTRIQRLLKMASFRSHAACEALDMSTPRGLDKRQIQDLATTRFIDDGVNVVIMGPTGVGKTHLATAIGNSACRNGRSTLFYRMNNLIEKLAMARAQNTYLHLLRKLAGCDLLILDDLGIKPLTPPQFQDLYDILDERGDGKATVVTTQVPTENWSEIIADPIVCEAITDRIVTRSIKLIMKGDSYRKKAKSVDQN